MSASQNMIVNHNDQVEWELQSEISKCLLCKDALCACACPKNLKPDQRIRSLYFQNVYSACTQLPEDPCLYCDRPCERACVLKNCTAKSSVKIRAIMESLDRIYRQKKEKTIEAFEPDLSMDICGVKLENPFLLSSSVVASNYEMCAKAFETGWAGVCYKTICTFDQHEASPRFSALRNRPENFYGFKNIEQLSDHSVKENMEVFQKLKKKYPSKVIIASIMGKNEEEWEELARCCQRAGADVIELNFSCPNMEDGDLGITIGQSEKLIEKFTRAARKGCTVPLLAKMTPNITDMVPMAVAAKRGGADGIAAINTIKSITGVEISNMTPEPNVNGRSALGGYSGAAVKPIALRFISDLADSEELKGSHISGMGGIENWYSALEFILLGAGSLQVTTAVMQYGYRIVEDMINGLRGYMVEHGIRNLYQLKGGACKAVVGLDNLERDTVLFPVFDLEKCIGCGRCEISCYDGGHQAIVFNPVTRKPTLNGAKCVGCHLCRLVCPCAAIGTAQKRIYRKPVEKEIPPVHKA
ncbi:MAG: NAD-dependent dihydropyrimidine dehydrogenase subunit PreA [Lachnospiraceae bacterium]|nr:NAD-dependent dihydropyrimidine dehydrogenase subunit PreA [Lachnospiraceae bacterium]